MSGLWDEDDLRQRSEKCSVYSVSGKKTACDFDGKRTMKCPECEAESVIWDFYPLSFGCKDCKIVWSKEGRHLRVWPMYRELGVLVIWDTGEVYADCSKGRWSNAFLSFLRRIQGKV